MPYVLTVVVALLASLVVTPPAEAHNGTRSASIFWTAPATAPGGFTLRDPHLNFNASTSRFEFDVHMGGGSCANVGSHHLWVYGRSYDANYAPTTAWAQVTALAFSSSSWCSNYASGYIEHQSTGAGGTHYELRIYASPVNGGWTAPAMGTSGTQILRAKTANFDEGPPTPTDLQVLSTSPGGKTLTYDMVAALALRAGWSRSQAITATAVARAESSFRTKAISYTGCCHGIWQVNSGVHNTTAEAMFDPWANAQKAYSIYQGSGSWQPWEAYTLGMHEQFIADATAAVDRQIANDGQAFFAIPNAPVTESGSVTLGWTIAACASCSYDVRRTTTAGSGYTTLGTASSLTYVDRNAAAGTTYYYSVRSKNASGTSAWTADVGVTTGAADPAGDIGSEYQGENGLGGAGATDPDAGTDDDGNGVDCSWWNLFCHLKAAFLWAFKPGSGAMDAWNDFKDLMVSKPPFSVVAGLGGFVIDLFFRIETVWEISTGESTGEAMCLNIGFDLSQGNGINEPACLRGPMLNLAQAPLVAVLRYLMMMVVLWRGSFALWNVFRTGFSDAPTSADVNLDSGVSEDEERAA